MNRSLKSAVAFILAFAMVGALACVAQAGVAHNSLAQNTLAQNTLSMTAPVLAQGEKAAAMDMAAGPRRGGHPFGHTSDQPGALAGCALVCPPFQAAPPVRVSAPVATLVPATPPAAPHPLPPGTAPAPEAPPPR